MTITSKITLLNPVSTYGNVHIIIGISTWVCSCALCVHTNSVKWISFLDL